MIGRLVRRARRLARRLLGPRPPQRRPGTDAPSPKPPEVEHLITSSPFFDAGWYALAAGLDAKDAALEHYLTVGRELGISPHPLIDPDQLRVQLELEDGDDPVAVYLRSLPDSLLSPHPLFDASRYLIEAPEAAGHRWGPVGHYLEYGAGAGLRPNAWFEPGTGDAPAGLAEWVRSQAEEYAAERATYVEWSPTPPAQPAKDGEPSTGLAALSAEPGPVVSVTVLLGGDAERAGDILSSVLDQTFGNLEVLVAVPDGAPDVRRAVTALPPDPRMRLLPARQQGEAQWLAQGADESRGRYLAWLVRGDVWAPEHLAQSLDRMLRDAVRVTQDVVEYVDYVPARGESQNRLRRRWSMPASEATITGGVEPQLSSVVMERALLEDGGGFDSGLHRGAVTAMLLTAFARAQVSTVQAVGVRTRSTWHSRHSVLVSPSQGPAIDHDRVESWRDVAVSRHVIDWESLRDRTQAEDTVSVIVPTYEDWRMTTRAVESLFSAGAPAGRQLDVLVLDNGCSLPAFVALRGLRERFPIQLLRSPVNLGFALGNDVALIQARGAVIVFLNNDTMVTARWLEPLLEALADPAVAGAQSLLLYPSGSIQSAGVAFPSCGGIPHALLQGFPEEDAALLDGQVLHALTGAALAVRFSQVAAVGAFDPIFRNGMEDIDLCLRLEAAGAGTFRVCPSSVVVHDESKSQSRFLRTLSNRRLFLDRWGSDLPGDDVALWSRVGFDVMGHEVRREVSADRRLGVPLPVLVRHRPMTVAEAPPSLRWAIKNPAPPDETRETWGDTYFARQLRKSLERLGQQVVIDYRTEFERTTGHHDDVAVVLRGLSRFRPTYGQVSLGWVISHPERIGQAEAASYDRLLAASDEWAQRKSKEWGLRVDTLLQATDAELFHPDRAEPDSGPALLFVGSSRQVRRPLVGAAVDAGLPLTVIGPQWEGLIPAELVAAEFIPNEELGAAYRAAGVVLNDHWEDMREEGFLSNRLFDAVAAGARVVTDDVAGLGGVFGRSVQVARSGSDLRRLTDPGTLDDVFGDDEERRRTAARVRTEHSFDARAKQLLETALEVRSDLSRARRAGDPEWGQTW